VFLMPGHSMMGCDRDFGHIKLKIMQWGIFERTLHSFHWKQQAKKQVLSRCSYQGDDKRFQHSFQNDNNFFLYLCFPYRCYIKLYEL
jgi:hypothetical protein